MLIKCKQQFSLFHVKLYILPSKIYAVSYSGVYIVSRGVN